MTLKEFSNKYQVPYATVYEASYKVHPLTKDQKDREWPEKELLTETHRLVCKRIKFHRAAMDKNITIKERLEGVW